MWVSDLSDPACVWHGCPCMPCPLCNLGCVCLHKRQHGRRPKHACTHAQACWRVFQCTASDFCARRTGQVARALVLLSCAHVGLGERNRQQRAWSFRGGVGARDEDERCDLPRHSRRRRRRLRSSIGDQQRRGEGAVAWGNRCPGRSRPPLPVGRGPRENEGVVLGRRGPRAVRGPVHRRRAARHPDGPPELLPQRQAQLGCVRAGAQGALDGMSIKDDHLWLARGSVDGELRPNMGARGAEFSDHISGADLAHPRWQRGGQQWWARGTQATSRRRPV